VTYRFEVLRLIVTALTGGKGWEAPLAWSMFGEQEMPRMG